MRRMKVCLLTLAFAGAVSTAWAGEETWQLESVHGKIGFHPELMRDLGISAQPSVGADSYYRIVTPFEATSCPIWRPRFRSACSMCSRSGMCRSAAILFSSISMC